MARRGALIQQHPVHGESRAGGSSWQSVARGATSIETDYLNGEIVLLGRRHDVPTPVNTLLGRIASQVAVGRARPAAITVEASYSLLGKP